MQGDVWDICAWCCHTDDLVDTKGDGGSADENNKAMLQDLSKWEYQFERLWE